MASAKESKVTPSPNHPRAAFVIGVTGNMKFAGYRDDVRDPSKYSPAVRAVYETVHRILEWTRASSPARALDPKTRTWATLDAHSAKHADVWPELGLKQTPIVVLSSLAPGIDTLFAEAALDYAAKTGVDVSVRAMLPFPLEIYREASTFHGDDGRPSRSKLERLDGLVTRIRAQPGFVAERDLVDVALHPDVDGTPREDLEAGPVDRPRRKLRYRAAGEYVAATSHLLIAAYDETEATTDDPRSVYTASARAIVEAKRRGLMFRLLASSNSFSWADNGPVLQIPIDRKGDGSAACVRPLAMLHPYDVCPPTYVEPTKAQRVLVALGIRRAEPPKVVESTAGTCSRPEDWHHAGDAVMRTILLRQDEFNACPTASTAEGEALEKLVGKEVRQHRNASVARMVAWLEPLARIRARASALAGALDTQRGRLLVRLLLLIGIGAAALGAYEHWVPQVELAHTTDAADDGAHDGAEAHEVTWLVRHGVGITQATLLATTLLSLLLIGLLYFRYLAVASERKRYDWRAIAEGLRVQAYWCLCGVGGSVSSDLMQRQRSELDWIRYVVSALASPVERWVREFKALDLSLRAQLLGAAHREWVRGQIGFFHKNGALAAAKQHRCHHWGWTLLAAGLLNVIAKFFAAVSPRVEHAVHASANAIAAWGLGVGVAILIGYAASVWFRGPGAPHADHDGAVPHRSFVGWITARPALWGWAFVIAAAPLWISHRLGPVTMSWPDSHEWWLILTGVVLLCGGLSLAWSERSFHGEDARRYGAMEQLFLCADRRLAELIPQYAKTGDERVLAEIHDILFQLGKEALDENAEWLILHRTRPLEPFLAA